MHTDIDKDCNNLISYNEAEAMTQLHIDGRGISNMKGIEAFINLDSLNCRNNNISSLDVSNCTALKSLNCGENRLTNLDVSNCPDLEALDCSYNQLVDLDVSNNLSLRELECGYNDITILDVLNNTLLVRLDCIYNQLTSLDVSNCLDLEYLNIFKNQLTDLDLSKNLSLIYLFCSNNQLTCLDISKNTALEWIEINDIPNLYFVCTWTSPFPPPGTDISSIGSQNVYFSYDCELMNKPPDLQINTVSVSMFEIGDLELTGANDLMLGKVKSMNHNTSSFFESKPGLIIPDDFGKYQNPINPGLSYNVDELTDSVDWSSSDSPVKNQALYTCGACWAFAATALIENLSNHPDLSEQAIISCADTGNCNGGWTGMALKYFHEKGVPPENCFPFIGANGACPDKCTDPAYLVKVSKYDFQPKWLLPNTNTVNDLKWLLQTGPVIVSMDLPRDNSSIEFFTYTGGIYNYVGGYILNPYGHSVLVVCYNDKEQYFRVKNSWGPGWGENGYFRIAYDDVTDDIHFGGYACTASGVYAKRQGDEFILSNNGGGILEILDIITNSNWLNLSTFSSHSMNLRSDESVTIDCIVDWSMVPCPSDTAIVTIYSNDQDKPEVELTVTATTYYRQKPDIAIINGPSVVNPGSLVNYSASASFATSFKWSVPSGWIINSGNGTSSISVTVGDTSGVINVRPSNNCGKNDSSFYTVNVYPTYILTRAISDKIHIYPNPAQNIIYIEIPENSHTKRIELLDLTGRITRTFNNQQNNKVTINCETLSSGIYFIRIHSDDIYTEKVIIR